ncbi:DUF924 family protein [Sphingomonas sp. LY54]|uniref:DUF924 family protein n=1 Tax=Sphingomonas sp. LY54 TaxID=3095343 RepID=UPI002D76A8E2|nr:DUF924 family protein [Sphingomonas sp. LY54]WRP27320.1 DUF924 family protein [Sphingomonas sp. LY54]
MTAWADDVLAFWFALRPEQWFKADPELDAETTERFGALWKEQAQRLPEDFLGSPREALAAVILFDQFPRNMFRGHADSFATDHLALAIAGAAVDRGCDEQLGKNERTFLYMPFEHSERLADQERAVRLMGALGDPELLRFAQLHHDVIARFGRFPHRNAVLGRTPRPEEIAAGEVVPW